MANTKVFDENYMNLLKLASGEMWTLFKRATKELGFDLKYETEQIKSKYEKTPVHSYVDGYCSLIENELKKEKFIEIEKVYFYAMETWNPTEDNWWEEILGLLDKATKQYFGTEVEKDARKYTQEVMEKIELKYKQEKMK